MKDALFLPPRCLRRPPRAQQRPRPVKPTTYGPPVPSKQNAPQTTSRWTMSTGMRTRKPCTDVGSGGQEERIDAGLILAEFDPVLLLRLAELLENPLALLVSKAHT
eukprot:scaffold36396_cov63-Phaeocystis_antarctica.AAC.1